MTSCISVSRQWPLLPIFSDYSASVEKTKFLPPACTVATRGATEAKTLAERGSRSEVLMVGQDSTNQRAAFHPQTGYKSP